MTSAALGLLACGLSMSLITAPSATTSSGTIAVIIIGVLAFSAALTAYLGWMGQRAVQSAERAEREPRYKRRRLLWKGMTYIACTLLALTLVTTGREPKGLLIGLPLGVAFALVLSQCGDSSEGPS